MKQPEHRKMLFELLVCFLVALLGLKLRSLLLLVGEILLFSYLHYMFLPVVFVIGYIVGTIVIGYYINKKCVNYNDEGAGFLNLFLGMIFLTNSGRLNKSKHPYGCLPGG